MRHKSSTSGRAVDRAPRPPTRRTCREDSEACPSQSDARWWAIPPTRTGRSYKTTVERMCKERMSWAPSPWDLRANKTEGTRTRMTKEGPTGTHPTLTSQESCERDGKHAQGGEGTKYLEHHSDLAFSLLLQVALKLKHIRDCRVVGANVPFHDVCLRCHSSLCTRFANRICDKHPGPTITTAVAARVRMRMRMKDER